MDRASLRLCLVTDRDLAGGRALTEVVAAAVRGGVTLVQLREKTAVTRRFVAEAAALLALLRPLGIPLLINDRLDVALAVDADGVHVGQDDMPVARVRALLGAGKIVGLSITRLDELRGSPLDVVDYIGVGPVFAQSTKVDASPPLGLDGLTAIRRATRVPMIAIGGIGPGTAADTLSCGVDGVAVVSAVMGARDPETAARDLMSILDGRG